MDKIFNGGFTTPRVCHCKSKDSDPLVKNDLSITPRRMYELTLQGKPISEQTAAYQNDFIDGYTKLDFEPPHVYQRHADIISCFNTQIESRSKLNKYVDSLSSEPKNE